MIGKQTIEDKDIPVSEVKAILEKRKKEGELSYEQNLAFEYSNEFGKLKVTSARELVDALMKIEGVDNSLAVQIADNLPADKDDITVLIEKKRKSFSEADIKKILHLVAEAQK